MIDKNNILRGYAITRKENPNTYRYEWCICKIGDNALHPPLTFGDTIEKTIENFMELIEEGELN